eukprot:gene11220-15055_t
MFPGPIKYIKTEYTPISQSDDYESLVETRRSDNDFIKQLKSLPYFLNPYIIQNMGIFQSYFNVGIAYYILTTPLSIYLISTLDISTSQYNAYATLISLPWSFKFLFGIISDGVPIIGYRRKSWMVLGWSTYILFSFILSTYAKPGFILITCLQFIMTISYIQADVCHDALCVERAKFEFEEIKGNIQTAGYTLRSTGFVIGAILATLLYNSSSWGWGLTISQIFLLTSLIPLTNLMPFLWNLEEMECSVNLPSFSDIVNNVWDTLQLKAVWYPMIFLYTYEVMQIPNAAWTNFLVDGLDFTDFELGLMSIAAALLYWFGMIIFKTFFFNSSWRMIYFFTTTVNFVFSIGQVLLVLRLNKYLGIPDLVFAVGDNGVTYFLTAVNLMPSCIMFAMLCREGSEGVTYALLTTILNLGGSLSSAIGTALSNIWDVSNDTLKAGDFSGVLKLTILTSCLQLSPMLLVFILPDTRAEQQRLRDSGEKNWKGGFTLFIVLTLSLIITVTYSIYEI